MDALIAEARKRYHQSLLATGVLTVDKNGRDIHTEVPPVMLDPLLKQKLLEGKETPLDECISEDQVDW